MRRYESYRSVLLVLTLTLICISLQVTSAAAFPPVAWDWRDVGGVNYVSGVRNQGACGNCYILMPLELIESREMIEIGRAGGYVADINYSEQYIMSCGTGYFGDFDCGGGFPKDTLTFVQNTGVPLEECYEYTATDTPCPSTCPDSGGEPELHQIPGPVTAFADPTDAQLMQEIYDHGPVATHMDIYNDFYSYSTGIYRHITGSYLGGKAMLIVGYGSDGLTDYWICKNSWGTGWGEGGFFKIVRGGGDNCNFGSWAYYATVGLPATDVDESQPPIVRYRLSNHPNPFNPRTTLSFGVALQGWVTLSIHDASGRLLRTLVDGELDASPDHSVVWDGCDGSGRPLPSGVYFSKLTTASFETNGKLALIR